MADKPMISMSEAVAYLGGDERPYPVEAVPPGQRPLLTGRRSHAPINRHESPWGRFHLMVIKPAAAFSSTCRAAFSRFHRSLPPSLPPHFPPAGEVTKCLWLGVTV